MKKELLRWVAILLVFCLALGLTFYFEQSAYADAVTASIIGASALAIMEASGLSIYGNAYATGTSIGTFMTNAVESYCAGRPVSDVFPGVVSAVAGKLMIPATIYNAITDFIDSFMDHNNIDAVTGTQSQQLYTGTCNGYPVYVVSNNTVSGTVSEAPPIIGVVGSMTGVGFELLVSLENEKYYYQMYENGTVIMSGNFNYYSNYAKTEHRVVLGMGLVRSSQWGASDTTVRKVIYTKIETSSGTFLNDFWITSTTSGSGLDSNAGALYDVANTGYDPISVASGYAWEGTIDGVSQDETLNDIVGHIYQGSSMADLTVDADSVPDEPQPTPVPTAVPTYPPAPDILPGINTGIEIGNDLIAGQATQTGVIEQGLEGVQEGVESLTETITDALSVPDAQEAATFKFDLRTLFPFCIPFDIYNLIQAFDGNPEAPHIQLPLVIDSINFSYMLDLDFTPWNPVAQLMRQVELIVYAIGLAWATSKAIRW